MSSGLTDISVVIDLDDPDIVRQLSVGVAVRVYSCRACHKSAPGL